MKVSMCCLGMVGGGGATGADMLKVGGDGVSGVQGQT